MPPGECLKINKASCNKCPTCSIEDQKKKPDLILEVEEAQKQVQKDVNDYLLNIGNQTAENNIHGKLYPFDISTATNLHLKQRIRNMYPAAGLLNDFKKTELINICEALESRTIDKESKKKCGNSLEDFISKIRTKRVSNGFRMQ